MNNNKIGIIDSGVGGLTVVQEIRKVMPRENILYLGDNINVPYGNKDEAEIYRLTRILIDYLIGKDVKLIAVACNTISSILDDYFQDVDIPIVSIIEPVSEYVAESKSDKTIGLLATNFTIASGLYKEKISANSPGIDLVTEACPSLAKVIDDAEFSYDELEFIVDLHLMNLRNKGKNIENIILGCTHYPIIKDIFFERGLDFNFIDPAQAQVEWIKNILKEKDLLAKREEKGTLEILTTADEEVYEKVIKYLKMEDVSDIRRIVL